MTNEEIETRFVQLAEAVTRVANTVAQVTDAQLALQTLSGRLAEVVLELRQEVRELRQELRELRQRQAESDQRFEVLLQEIRFLIRRQGEGQP
ncbi:hypothetical protein NW813_01315 [Synechococcus sp. R55.6]|jgi:methyl-accepting chemotaxis protein|uniref:hypothetical protein n=1 Tax=unclassified Synechococcus TaxID=2626047 RepID=UPI0000694BE2|nr:hypothetical protein [Synechococcus sp. JA-2-3B'a(2-13)]ABD01645.1 hypothetical protein CYB_0659 [Synechococcus sp. JA-2-3B'a(2-13)]